MPRLVYLRSCAADLMWLRKYYSNVFPAGETKARAQFNRVRAALLDHPRLGGKIDGRDDLREFFVPKTPFSYLYRLREDRIEGLRIFDNRSLKNYPET